jgi:hypothetical protein
MYILVQVPLNPILSMVMANKDIRQDKYLRVNLSKVLEQKVNFMIKIITSSKLTNHD